MGLWPIYFPICFKFLLVPTLLLRGSEHSANSTHLINSLHMTPLNCEAGFTVQSARVSRLAGKQGNTSLLSPLPTGIFGD